MATRSAAELLTSVDSIFTTQEERDNAQRSYVTDLPTAEISDFPNHPFKVRMDESMTELADSVKERGVLSPVLVRPMPDGGYQMVAGHRRKMAAELAELPTVPCIVRELTDDEAVIIMVDSNLQRDRILPSEKAFAYKMKLDAMKRQTDDRFMKMSQRYDEEQQQLKKEIAELQGQCDKEDNRAFCKDQFLKAVRKFMEMKTLTPTILHELVERIDVYQTQGRGKNRTQRIVIHYNFIGVLDMPEVEEYPDNVVLDSRQGVAVEYLVGKAG